ncbi:uncharacterized protein EURHEDRAFT_376845 [Aspergillus ruber CBS 135680]|uniref:Uncharacterized protein n=1 Tax=Aspergillus ruber (strain CBS 135680) TaxID=1388766 RepID=A0A017SGJ6_ASPRC|nr:uncharacterized protein EURHEDRAFT_376845 [Aspergillus ruber CBS 135680]EYE95784.1 hypothetical protein EURHEDRAFT_376845 [Aspergillus ruber CBS 135680]
MPKFVQITFEGVEAWEDNYEEVNKILEELTGTDEYPSTKSLPPIIFGADLDEYGIERLKSIEGVVVHVSEEDDD